MLGFEGLEEVVVVVVPLDFQAWVGTGDSLTSVDSNARSRREFRTSDRLYARPDSVRAGLILAPRRRKFGF
jgi:hypothetical protein